MYRRESLAVIATALGLAGCVGGPSSDPAAVTDTPIPSARPTTTPTATRSPTLERGDVPPEQVIAYDDLSAEQQTAFRRAQNETVVFSSSLPADSERDVDFVIDVSIPFREHKYVRKGGTLFTLQVNGPHRIGATRIEVSPAPDDGNRTAVHLDNRTGEGYELLKQAIETDGTAEGTNVQRPDAISTGDIVEYGGTRYEVSHLSHRDYGYFEMTVEKRS
jgi:hypothetical protein